MWTCKHCKLIFEFGMAHRNAKANHSRWCQDNPAADAYRRTNGKNNKCWNKGLTKETDVRLLALSNSIVEFYVDLPGTFTGKTHTEETKSSISASMNGNRNANHRGDRQSFYKDIRMDSRWEVGTARYLDKISVVWKYNEFGYKLSDGRYYYPDFFIYENDILVKVIEVKGYFREKNKQKYEQFLCEYPDVPIELWQKDKLIELEIINKSGYIKE